MGISIGLVGLGGFGSGFAAMYKNHPDVDRIALCDREPERVRRFADRADWGDKLRPSDCYGDLDAILASDVDALVVMTQPWLHAPQCIRALESGKHVYSAVPVMYLPDGDEILDWCDRLVGACRRTGMHYMLGETTFYHPETMFGRRQARAGAFGTFVLGEGEYWHDVDAACNLREVARARGASAAGREWNAVQAAYRERGVKSGPMFYPTHSLSGPLSVMGTHAVKVTCRGTPCPPGDDFFADSAFANQTAFFTCANGATMRICEWRRTVVDGERFTVHGTDASLVAGGGWRTRAGQRNPTAEEMREPLPPDVLAAFRAATGEHGEGVYGGHNGSHAYLVHEFVDSVARGRRPAIDAWTAARWMAAGVAAHQSSLRDGASVDVVDWGAAPDSAAARTGAGRSARG